LPRHSFTRKLKSVEIAKRNKKVEVKRRRENVLLLNAERREQLLHYKARYDREEVEKRGKKKEKE